MENFPGNSPKVDQKNVTLKIWITPFALLSYLEGHLWKCCLQLPLSFLQARRGGLKFICQKTQFHPDFLRMTHRPYGDDVSKYRASEYLLSAMSTANRIFHCNWVRNKKKDRHDALYTAKEVFFRNVLWSWNSSNNLPMYVCLPLWVWAEKKVYLTRSRFIHFEEILRCVKSTHKYTFIRCIKVRTTEREKTDKNFPSWVS